MVRHGRAGLRYDRSMVHMKDFEAGPAIEYNESKAPAGAFHPRERYVAEEHLT